MKNGRTTPCNKKKALHLKAPGRFQEMVEDEDSNSEKLTFEGFYSSIPSTYDKSPPRRQAPPRQGVGILMSSSAEGDFHFREKLITSSRFHFRSAPATRPDFGIR